MGALLIINDRVWMLVAMTHSQGNKNAITIIFLTSLGLLIRCKIKEEKNGGTGTKVNK